MPADWLGEAWPQLYPILPDSLRFPGLKPWGEAIDRTAAGVYIVIALDPETSDERRRMLPRLLASDPTGTLYIGATGNLAGRLGEVCRAIRSDQKGGGHGLQKLKESPWREIFPPEFLAICWFPTADKDSAHKLEATLAICRYSLKFGERPPFDGFK